MKRLVLRTFEDANSGYYICHIMIILLNTGIFGPVSDTIIITIDNQKQEGIDNGIHC